MILQPSRNKYNSYICNLFLVTDFEVEENGNKWCQIISIFIVYSTRNYKNPDSFIFKEIDSL